MTGQRPGSGRVPTWGPHALPRALHPGAWWLWACAVAIAASRTTDILTLALLITAAAIVVTTRRIDAPWSRSFTVALTVGLVLVVLRLAMQAVLAPPIGDTVLLSLPRVELPSWIAGIRLGGMVTAESLTLGLQQGLRIAAVIAAVGAAASLASPTRLLRSLPAAVYETGVAAVVALTFLPQLVHDLQRVTAARRLRGRPAHGPRAWMQVASTVMDGALDRSVTLAAAMDSRGYGRRVELAAGHRRTADGMLLGGLALLVIGAYVLLDDGGSTTWGAVMAVTGLVGAVVAVVMAGRRSPRTRHRRDQWAAAEWIVTACAGVIVTATLLSGTTDGVGIGPASLLAVVVACLPAAVSPPPSMTGRVVVA